MFVRSQNGLSATRASFLSGRKLRQAKTNWAAPTARKALSVAAEATERPIWFPGSTPPPWLDGRFIFFILSLRISVIYSRLVLVLFT